MIRNSLLAGGALLVGMFIPVQAALNATLARALGGVARSSLVLFTVGLISAAAVLAAQRQGLPTAPDLARAPGASYLGGVIVAGYVFAITFLAPRLGVGTAIAFVVAGQMIAAGLIDHFGLFGVARHPLTLVRLLGVVLLVTGAFLAKRPA